MEMFKLTPKPQADFRLEVNEIKKICKVEKHGYRHNKIVYGFCEELPDFAALQSLGMSVEALACDQAQLDLMDNLIARGRAKSKIDHLKNEQAEHGAEEAEVQKRLEELNNNIQTAKEALGITGTLIVLKL